ncbi:hypothetical protein B0A48_17578 [Cryoendolithus antarcticus]|uniref:RanBD1 domain-containing protein n=1 Tax=Cryoendolithus antarcticus TaxID=1507870 RepID=A0A1V8SB20_9PEZI|nr:hypothetical protein B0A48_17578 [Cryoendolithus antarcticus]
MSKRGAEGQGGEERYGGYEHGGGPDGTADKPRTATAAQMAQRKIKSLKGRPGTGSVGRRTASPSPMPMFPPQQQQQPAGPVQFNSAAPSSFSFGAQQPQQQGFGFGASQPQQATSSFTFGQSQPQAPQQNNMNGSASFGGFGQQPQPNGSASPSLFGGFGQQQPQQNGNSTPSFTFGAAPSQPQQNGSNPFQQPQQNGSTQSSNAIGGFSAQPSQPATNGTSQSTLFNGFGNKSQDSSRASTPFLGSQSDASTKPAAPSNGFQFGKTAPASSSPFNGFSTTQPAAQPNTSNIFNPSVNKSIFEKPAETPKANGWASFTSGTPSPSQANGTGASVLSGWSQQQATKSFTGFTPAQAAQPDAQDQDDAMISPQKQQSQPSTRFSFEPQAGQTIPFGTAQQGANVSDASASVSTPGKSPFDSITPADTAPTPAQPLFGFGQNKSPAAVPSEVNETASTPKAPTIIGNDLFSRISYPDTSRESSQESHTPTPQSPSLFIGFGAQITQPSTPSANLFAGKTNEAPPSEVPASTKGPSTGNRLFAPSANAGKSLFTPAAPSKLSQTTIASPPHVSTLPMAKEIPRSTPATTSSPYEREMRKLNKQFMAQCQRADRKADLTLLCEYYMSKTKELKRKNGKAVTADISTDEATPKAAPAASTSNLFSGAASKTPSMPPEQPSVAAFVTQPVPETPTPKPAGRLFQNFAASIPAQKRKPDDEADRDIAPATEKRSRPNDTVDYPSLSQDSSNTSKLFASVITKNGDSGLAASTSAQFQPKAAETPAVSSFGGFKPINTAPSESPSSAGGFKPINNTSNGPASSPGGFTPTMPATGAPSNGTAGFKPSVPSGGATMDAFAEAARKTAAAERKRARDEEFDSEEDDPEEWERGWQERQAKKKQRLDEAAKTGKSFSFSAPSTSVSTVDAFAEAARKNAAAERERARDEEFDSEEDDPEVWEASWNERQATKKRKLEEAAKSGKGFSFSAPSAAVAEKPAFSFAAPATTANGTAHDNAENEDTATKTPAAKPAFKPSTSFFGSAAKPLDGTNKAEDDHTWKQGTPIKFGGAVQPPPEQVASPAHPIGLFANVQGGSLCQRNSGSPAKAVDGPADSMGGSLFVQNGGPSGTTPGGVQGQTLFVQNGETPARNTGGMQGGSLFMQNGNTPAKSLFGQTSSGTPAVNGNSLFNFNKTGPATPAFSFAQTPAKSSAPVSTNGDNTDANDTADEAGDAAPAEPQIGDLTALQASELAENTLLHHVPKAKAYKFCLANPSAETPTWVEKALGPLWLLKSNATGKVRLLMRVPPLGKVAMNFGVLKDAQGTMYEVKGKRVMAAFVDTVEDLGAKGLSKWNIAFGKEDDAKEVARIFKEEAAQA